MEIISTVLEVMHVCFCYAQYILRKGIHNSINLCVSVLLRKLHLSSSSMLILLFLYCFKSFHVVFRL
jgi:hypothetical protein